MTTRHFLVTCNSLPAKEKDEQKDKESGADHDEKEEEEEEEADGGVAQRVGCVTVLPSYRDGTYVHEDDVNFVLRQNKKGSNKNITLEVTHLNPQFDGPDEVEGDVKVVAERTAVRYMSEDIGHGPYEHRQKYARSIQFDTVEEAQALLDEYQKGKEITWITKLIEDKTDNSINVPADISKLIGCFATSKPPPVLIFEEGDLFINFVWDPGHRSDDFETNIVVRGKC